MKVELSPALDEQIKIGVKKANLSLRRTVPYGLLAGFYIALGALAMIIIQSVLDQVAPGASFIVGSFSFTIGIVAVLIGGAELFTGNILLIQAVCHGEISFKEAVKNWAAIFCLNFLGALFLLFLVHQTGILNEQAIIGNIARAEKKVAMTFGDAFLRGVACNLIVCLSVWLANKSHDTTAKVLTSAFAVYIFVITGFEHCVANMFYIPLGMVEGASVSLSQLFLNNLLPVTLGNIVGGMIIGILYYYAESTLEYAGSTREAMSNQPGEIFKSGFKKTRLDH